MITAMLTAMHSVCVCRFKLDEAILLSTSDHCFDPALVYEMLALPLQQYEQCGRVLVEEDVTVDEAAALPMTAVHVERAGSQARHLWQTFYVLFSQL
jgi:hypothetical protein